MCIQKIEQLRQAHELAEADNRAKSLLVAKLGHELKTPLNAIVGLAQLVRMHRGRDTQAVDDWIDQIARIGWHMADVIDTLIELGPSSAGGLRGGGECFDVSEPLAEAVDIVRQDAARRGVHIAFVGDMSTAVRADRRALRQVFVNLLSNAVKYNSERGLVRVSVSPGERASITIRDTGPGLTSEQQERLFRPFERLGAEGVRGHGLGLVVCKELLTAMGGCIQVESAEGAGCAFTVSLPVADAVLEPRF